MSVVMFVLSFLIALAIFRWSRGWVHYDTM